MAVTPVPLLMGSSKTPLIPLLSHQRQGTMFTSLPFPNPSVTGPMMKTVCGGQKGQDLPSFSQGSVAPAASEQRNRSAYCRDSGYGGSCSIPGTQSSCWVSFPEIPESSPHVSE